MILKTQLLLLAAACSLSGRGRRGGSDEPSASGGSPAAGGGHSGRGPGVGLARLAARLLLPHGFPSQVTGDRAGGGLGWL